jgi:molybdenum cofactor cytidylyltransferase
MGTPKQLLPWGERTVIATVVANLAAAGCDPVVVVTGHAADAVLAALEGTGAQTVANPDYVEGEMFSSYRAAVRHLLESEARPEPQAAQLAGALFALGDQPHVPVEVIAAIVEQARLSPEKIVIPSHAMRRGHPFYIPKHLWRELLSLDATATLRDLVRRHDAEIVYVDVSTDAILKDMDTPEEYAALGRGNAS